MHTPTSSISTRTLSIIVVDLPKVFVWNAMYHFKLPKQVRSSQLIHHTVSNSPFQQIQLTITQLMRVQFYNITFRWNMTIIFTNLKYEEDKVIF